MTFKLTPEIEDELRATNAGEDLLDAIRAKSPAPSAVAPRPATSLAEEVDCNEATPEEKISCWYKAAQTGALARDAPTYFNLALAYQENEYAKADQAYRDVSKIGTPDSPEVKTALKTLQESTDHLLDALARAVTYATTPEIASIKTDSMPLLTSLYKFRNRNSEAGLQAFIASVASRPLPVPGQPIDYFPPSSRIR